MDKPNRRCPAILLGISVMAAGSGALAQGNYGQDSRGTNQASQSGNAAPSGSQDAATNRQQGQTGQGGNSAQSGAQGDKAAGKAKGNAGQSTSNGNSALYMIVPIPVVDESEAMKSGCWVRFYDDKNFKGYHLTMAGPAEMANMVGPFGFNWKNKVRSAETGRKARVLVYDNENFKDLDATINPGQKIPDLNKKMGFFDDFSSMRLVCDGKS